MHARLEVNLLRLSLQNVTGRRQPVVVDNDTRARLLRAALPSPTHNTHDWPHCQRERSPACHLSALPSRRVVGSYDDDYAQQMREGFEFKYGS